MHLLIWDSSISPLSPINVFVKGLSSVLPIRKIPNAYSFLTFEQHFQDFPVELDDWPDILISGLTSTIEEHRYGSLKTYFSGEIVGLKFVNLTRTTERKKTEESARDCETWRNQESWLKNIEGVI